MLRRSACGCSVEPQRSRLVGRRDAATLLHRWAAYRLGWGKDVTDRSERNRTYRVSVGVRRLDSGEK
jgi:hypothetical protein